MSDRLLWLIMLPFSRLSQFPIASRRNHARKDYKLGERWHPPCVVSGVIRSSQNSSLCISEVCIRSIPFSLSGASLRSNTCLYNIYLLRWDKLSVAWRIQPEDLHPLPVGTHPGCSCTAYERSGISNISSLRWCWPQEDFLLRWLLSR